MSNKASDSSSGISTDMVHGPETKPRWYEKTDAKKEFEVKDCSSGGKYQELPTMGAFTEVVSGSRTKRLHERNYCKVELNKKENILDSIIKTDTRGPPFENISVPKRVM